MKIAWEIRTFDQLTTQQLYDLIQLRIDVFVVEQQCPYADLDNKDTQEGVRHLLAYDEQHILVAYARLLTPGISYPGASIGRVITRDKVRGSGIGHQLLEQALTACQRYWPARNIEISAQSHLQSFYGRHGFITTSEVYLEDGIPHVHMETEPSSTSTTAV